MQKIKAHKQAFRRALRILYWVGLMILYLCAASRPGVWLRDAFLYRQTDGSFAGRDEYGIYALTVTAAEHETQAVFAMNGETIQYRIVTSSQEEDFCRAGNWRAGRCGFMGGKRPAGR